MKTSFEEVVEFFHSIGIERAKRIEEKDQQFQALQHLFRTSKRNFLSLTVANALVCYQLSGKGEDYWWEFARYFSSHVCKNVVEDMKVFLSSSKLNKRLLSTKIRRLERAQNILENIDTDTSFLELWEMLAPFGKKKKTTLFAVKMFGYAKRIATNSFSPYPMKIPIPVDSRIKKITSVLTDEDPLSFWQRVAELSKVPPLHIDSVLWTGFFQNVFDMFCSKTNQKKSKS